jgi:bifunctional UDP-N-acetylglucosamine pyrophosphorylase/glucosamine-1-phosphate N-acetyltransferase
MDKAAIILAAGLGTRMKSRIPKAAHKIAGAAMLTHLIKSAEQVFDQITVVIGPGQPELAALAAPHKIVIQQDRLGTAHAALQAAKHFGSGLTAIFYADNPLVSPATMRDLIDRLSAGDAKLVLLGTTPPDPGRYGRLIMAGDYVQKIAEYADATEAERAKRFCNAGALTATALNMRVWLEAVKPMNAKGEYYLTDIVEIARAEGAKIAAIDAPFEECMGINSRAELAQAEAAMQRYLRARAFELGASMTAPDTVIFCVDTSLAPDVTIGPYVVFGPGVTVKSGVEIKAFSHLESCIVHEHAIIGPYARLRPGAEIGATAHVGNFVEIKNATLGPGAKVNHLSYIGDAEIGEKTNIGAGTITCNYDGTHKHKTKIGANAFIGSNTAFVAPVSVGDNALIAAGSVITQDVPANTLAIARGRQANKPKREPK